MQEQIVNFLQHIPAETILQWLGTAGFLSLLMQRLKKWFEIQSSRVINFVNAILAFIVVAIQSLTAAVPTNPGLLTGKALSLMSLMILVYSAPYVGIKALSQLATDVKETRERKARMAATEVPIESVVPQVDVPVAVAPATPDEFASVE